MNNVYGNFLRIETHIRRHFDVWWETFGDSVGDTLKFSRTLIKINTDFNRNKFIFVNILCVVLKMI